MMTAKEELTMEARKRLSELQLYLNSLSDEGVEWDISITIGNAVADRRSGGRINSQGKGDRNAMFFTLNARQVVEL